MSAPHMPYTPDSPFRDPATLTVWNKAKYWKKFEPGTAMRDRWKTAVTLWVDQDLGRNSALNRKSMLKKSVAFSYAVFRFRQYFPDATRREMLVKRRYLVDRVLTYTEGWAYTTDPARAIWRVNHPCELPIFPGEAEYAPGPNATDPNTPGNAYGRWQFPDKGEVIENPPAGTPEQFP